MKNTISSKGKISNVCVDEETTKTVQMEQASMEQKRRRNFAKLWNYTNDRNKSELKYDTTKI